MTEKLAKFFYTPEYYNKDKMTIKDIIKRNTTSWGKDYPLISDSEYRTRYWLEFSRIHLIATMIFLFFTYGFLGLGKIYLMDLFKLDISTFDVFTGLSAFVYFIIYLTASFSVSLWYNGIKNNIPKDVWIFSTASIILYLLLFGLIFRKLIS